MTNQEIKDNAPSGATHYDDDEDYYLIDSGFLIWHSLRKDYVWYCSYLEGIAIGIKPIK